MPPVIVVAEPGFKHRKFLKWMFTGSDVMGRKQKCGPLQRVAPLRARRSASWCFVDKDILVPEASAVLAAGSCSSFSGASDLCGSSRILSLRIVIYRSTIYHSGQRPCFISHHDILNLSAHPAAGQAS